MPPNAALALTVPPSALHSPWGSPSLEQPIAPRRTPTDPRAPRARLLRLLMRSSRACGVIQALLGEAAALGLGELVVRRRLAVGREVAGGHLGVDLDPGVGR